MNKTSLYKLTVIVPVYNEQDTMSRIEKSMQEWIPTSNLSACILFVNDGSKDDSLNRMKEICARNRDMFYISLAQNCGLSAAMKAGIDATESQYVGYIDADLQTTPEDFNLLEEYLTEYQLVIGIRANRKDSAFKNFQSKFANGFRNMMTHDGVKDTGCPLKIMWTDYAKRIPFFTGMHRFLPALIQLQHGKVQQVPVRHFPRTEGVSKYNLWNRLIAPLKDCFAYRWMKKRYINYSIAEKNIENE